MDGWGTGGPVAHSSEVERRSGAVQDIVDDAVVVTARRHMPRFWRHVSLTVGLVTLGLILILTIGAPLFTASDPTAQNQNTIFLAPSSHFLFGTDEFGRDLWARVLYGGRWTIFGSLVSIVIAVVIGTGLGLIAGYMGGLVDIVIMRLMDLLLAFPGILLALAIATILGPGLSSAVIAIGVTFIGGNGRIVQGVTLQARHYAYVDAARALGVSHTRILWRHLLPSIQAQVIVLTTTGLGMAALSIAALGFLGLGPQPPTPEWGAILNDGRDYVTVAWWIAFFPGAAICLYVIAVSLLGDGVRELLDPTLARHRR
jgi:ABC-type dipeptide/oligopeptide/nickel transport system permease subunit